MALGLASLSHPALAQEAAPSDALQSATNPDGATVSRDTSYRGAVALLYGIGYAGSATGFFMARPDRPRSERPYGLRIAGAIILPSGVITTVFGPMLVHFDHGFLSKG